MVSVRNLRRVELKNRVRRKLARHGRQEFGRVAVAGYGVAAEAVIV
jgi:hypothetical protein